ncbi:Phosphoglucomutase [Rosistilla oblonga]|uniref:phospho-sugar mutase n=1 Tax=Rosistilla oblonga TaxID=2527990 RepID=UPI001187E47E|nr:phospho-sugar mutase [Rosistilla oblonga]QDV11699.1 Phosphoglucomutase [Rosistilla oblonga]
MTQTAPTITVETALAQIATAHTAGKLTAGAVENLRAWLSEDRYAAYRNDIVRHIEDEKWQKLDDVFWTIIPFGTGGRRGRMYDFGSNAINDRTIGESAQGLATYVKQQHQGSASGLSCAIAYDTRHKSRHFAELCAGIMVANGFKVYFLDDYRATPQLSFAVREKHCSCGIMVTASHNPPSDNAVKVYWSTGGQVLPPHDKAIIDRVMSTDAIEVVAFADALADGRVEICTEEIDKAFTDNVTACSFSGPRDAKILFTPLHGVGSAAVLPVLERVGFSDVEVFQPHAEPSGDFPNVPGHVSNPENKQVFDAPIEQASKEGFDLVMATDPDCDRLGCAAPLTTEAGSPWATLTGNQIGALLADYVLNSRKAEGSLCSDDYIVTTLVTTAMASRIAEHYGCRCENNNLVGFKYIAGVMDREGADKFAFGFEESHGYLIGKYARDKDAAAACMLMSELVAKLKSEGKTIHQQMDSLSQTHGLHAEHLINVMMEGSEGMALMTKLMAKYRQDPPKEIGGMKVAQVRDYTAKTITTADGSTSPLDGPDGDLVILDLDQSGNYFAVRPSGTEPKVKFYVFTYLPPEESQDLPAAKAKLADRLAAMEVDVRAFAKTVS